MVFDPWQQTSWDANDTVTNDPAADPDVGAYFGRLPDSDYLPTWYRARIDGALGPAEQSAAEKAARHADTPAVACFDTLGRTFLGVDDNGGDRKYRTRTVLDIEGNRRAVVDALDRVVIRCDFAMGGVQLYEASMEAGEHWLLKDVGGRPVRSWNSRRYEVRTEYDPLRRPIRSFVRGGDPYERNARPFAEEVLFERTIYGDSDETGLSEHRRQAGNLRGKPFRHFDTAGIVTTDRYDFKGNLLHSDRQFARDYRSVPDWSRDPEVEAERFAGGTTYDALNRPATVTSPDNSIYYAGYNETGLLARIDVTLRGAERDGDKAPTPFVRRIDYNARSQRTLVQYANGAATTYEYDAETFRLIRLKTVRRIERDALSAETFADTSRVQDLNYTYDPVGNITEIADHALRTVFHRNREVDPVCDYTYDPLYRLIAATGRENIGQSAFDFAPSDGDYRDYPFVGAGRLNDLQALQGFAEHYEYDPAGNFISLAHRAEHGSWTRHYAYREESLLEPDKHSNRLSQTHFEGNERRGPERYLYDARGNIVQMPHLPVMQWDFMERLAASARQVVNDGASETTFYQYDAAGQRARKVTERRDGVRRNERLYVGGFEIYREYDRDGDSIALERETLHVMDDKERIALVETLTRERGSSVRAPDPVQRYQLANHLGSATLELDEAARLISYEEYAPYGETVYQAGRHPAEVRRKRYRYTGMERDDENGFTYHEARYCAPWLGRWLGCDPMLERAPSRSSYWYCDGNPIVLNDRGGEQPKDLATRAHEWSEKAARFTENNPGFRNLNAKSGKNITELAEYQGELKAAQEELKLATAQEFSTIQAKISFYKQAIADNQKSLKNTEKLIEERNALIDEGAGIKRELMEEGSSENPMRESQFSSKFNELSGSRPPTQAGGGGPEGGEPPSAPPEGGGFWGGLKRLLGFGGKALDIGGKGLAVVSVATASNEGEALWASVGLLGAFGAFTPGVNIALAVIGGIGLGIAAGRAIYHWWKGPQATAPVIDIPLPPEQIGPVTHVAHDDPPPPPQHTIHPTVPHSLRMRNNKPAQQLHFSITKGYDPATGKSW